MTTRLLVMVLLCCVGASLIGSPASDLSSPVQGVRDAAAQGLRASYTPPARTNWDAVFAAVTNGMTKTNLLKLLAPFKVEAQPGFGSGGSHSEYYRLDDAWVLVCWFHNEGDTLFERELESNLKYVWVAPPPDFTGTWITYHVNGQKSHEIGYKAGKYHGQFIAYHPDGSKCVVQHYEHGVCEGADIGYYPSGRINYRGAYKAGKQVGTWVWYSESGTTNSIRNYPAP
jgi:hypothetical protein